MQTFELKTRLEILMRETGEGSKPILFITEDGEVYTIEKIAYDAENNAFYLHGALDE